MLRRVAHEDNGFLQSPFLAAPTHKNKAAKAFGGLHRCAAVCRMRERNSETAGGYAGLTEGVDRRKSKTICRIAPMEAKKAVDDGAMTNVGYLKERIFPEMRETEWPNLSIRAFETTGSRSVPFERLLLWSDGRYRFHISAYLYSCLNVVAMSKIFGDDRVASNATVRHTAGEYKATTREQDGPNASLVSYRYYIRADSSGVEYIDFLFENLFCAQQIDFERRSLKDEFSDGNIPQSVVNLIKVN